MNASQEKLLLYRLGISTDREMLAKVLKELVVNDSALLVSAPSESEHIISFPLSCIRDFSALNTRLASLQSLAGRAFSAKIVSHGEAWCVEIDVEPMRRSEFFESNFSVDLSGNRLLRPIEPSSLLPDESMGDRAEILMDALLPCKTDLDLFRYMRSEDGKGFVKIRKEAIRFSDPSAVLYRVLRTVDFHELKALSSGSVAEAEPGLVLVKDTDVLAGSHARAGKAESAAMPLPEVSTVVHAGAGVFSAEAVEETFEDEAPVKIFFMQVRAIENLFSKHAKSPSEVLPLSPSHSFTARYLLITLYLTRIISAVSSNKIDFSLVEKSLSKEMGKGIGYLVGGILLSSLKTFISYYRSRMRQFFYLATFRALAVLHKGYINCVSADQREEILILLHMNLMEIGAEFKLKNFSKGIPLRFVELVAAKCGPQFVAWLKLPENKAEVASWEFELKLNVDDRDDRRYCAGERVARSMASCKMKADFSVSAEHSGAKARLLMRIFTGIEEKTQTPGGAWKLSARLSAINIDIQGVEYPVPEGVKRIHDEILACLDAQFLKRDPKWDEAVEKITEILALKLKPAVGIFGGSRDPKTAQFYKDMQEILLSDSCVDRVGVAAGAGSLKR